MLKKLILVTAICGPLLMSAQQSKVVSAYNYLNNYNSEKSLDDLRNARKNIDEAALNDGTSGKPKTWYYRGNVYLAIFGSELKQEVPDALKNAAESYVKVYELDPKYEYAEDAYRYGVMAYKNLGILSFNESKFNDALAAFEKVVELSSKKGGTDKDAVENAAISAMRAKEYPKAIQYYKQFIGFNVDTSGVQHLQLYKALLANADTSAGMSVLKEARGKFPKNQDILIEQLRYYLAKSMSAEAETLLKEAIAADPNNHTLYLAAGSTFENQGKRKEALEAYEKAISLKPEAWEAYYNIGANYNNEGRRLQELANNEKDPKKYEAGIKIADEELKKALYNLEKAREYVPAGKDRQDVLNALKQLYVRLNMNDKYNEVKKELEGK